VRQATPEVGLLENRLITYYIWSGDHERQNVYIE
jgi:hypothetical protein